jgi:hypothetical protein
MRHILLTTALLSSLLLLGCDTPEDCGKPWGCGEDSSRKLTSIEVGGFLGLDEPTTAVLLDEQGHVPSLVEVSDELVYALTSEDLDTLALAAD